MADENKKFDLPRLFHNIGNNVNLDAKVCVVSIIGKSRYKVGHDKASHIHQVIGKQDVFLENNSKSENIRNTYIESVYDSLSHVVFLHLWSMYDTCQLVTALSNVQQQLDKDFYSVWHNEDFEHAKALLFLFSVSHIMLIIQPGTSFDVTLVRLFRILDGIRLKFQPLLSDFIGSLPISNDWIKAARMCSPRVLFIFETSQLAAISTDGAQVRPTKLSPEKKLAHSMEDQIYRILRKSRVITNISNNSLFAIPANQEFVFIKTNTEQDKSVSDPVTFYIDLLQKHCQAASESTSLGMMRSHSYQVRRLNRTNLEAGEMRIDSSDGLQEFLRQHIELALGNGFDDNTARGHVAPVFETSTYDTWLTVADKIYEFYLNQEKEMDMTTKTYFNTFQSLLEVDSHFSENRCAKVMPLAEAAYQEGLPKHYTVAVHSSKISHARRVFSQHARGPAYDKCLKQLEKDCCDYWTNGRQLCEEVSLTGQPCVNQLHQLPTDLEDDNRRDIPILAHNSQLTWRTSCNCGRKQVDRDDPFHLKEANYTFYTTLEKLCCHALEHFAFPVFKSTVSGAKAVATSPDKTMPQKKELHKYADAVTAGMSGLSLGQDSGGTGSDIYGHHSGLDQHQPATATTSSVTVSQPTNETSHVDDAESPSPGLTPGVLTSMPSTTEYLSGMIHTDSPPGLLPEFSSWSLVCLGKASAHNISHGLEQTSFMHGSNHLLPWDVTIKTEKEKWPSVAELSSKKGKHRKNSKSLESLEQTVRLYVGNEYECPRGHRFFCSGPEKVIKVPANGIVKDNANKLLQLDMPLYFPCLCSSKGLMAQLMRIFVTTPEPKFSHVHVTLNPKVQPGIAPCPLFMPSHEGPIKLPCNGGLWVLRLPYIYMADEEIYLMPADRAQLSACRILRGLFGFADTST